MYNLSWKKSSILYKSDKYWTAHLVGGHQVEIQNEENIYYFIDNFFIIIKDYNFVFYLRSS